MGYQPKPVFKFSLDRFNTVSGDIEVRADTLRDAEKLLKQIGILNLVSHREDVVHKSPPPRKL